MNFVDAVAKIVTTHDGVWQNTSSTDHRPA